MRRVGFTLVELMIVVAILGILAAIVMPTFQNNVTEAKTSSAKSNVRAIRAQIELYKLQHDGLLPGVSSSGNQTTLTTLERHFLYTSTIDGVASLNKVPSDPFLYGPYLLKLPRNPYNDLSNIVFSTDFATDAGNVSSGWLYNSNTGEICLNYPGTDEDGVAYIDY